MTRDDLDRILSAEARIVPSSGFTDSVMAAVRREAAVPPPIPFPWRRALPGLLFCIAGMIGLVIACFRFRAPEPSIFSLAQLFISARDALVHANAAAWIALALLLTLASVLFSFRATGSRM